MRYLFKNIDVPFGLFSKKQKHLYYDLKSSMCGGLSLVMKRLAIKDETRIRGDTEQHKLVKSIIGLGIQNKIIFL